MGWNRRPVRIIVSTGRTGTQFLADFFDQLNPEVEGFHEPAPDLVEHGIGYAVGAVDLSEVVQAIRQYRQPTLRELPEDSVYLEANNRLFSLIPALRNVFHNLRIVHVIRDGRDYVRSGLSRPTNFRYWYSPDDPYARRNLRLKATMFPDDPWHDEWDDMTPFEKNHLVVEKEGFLYPGID